jgi:hypothetical protein
MDDCAIVVLNQILSAVGGTSGVPFNLRGANVTAIAGTPVSVLTVAVPVATTRDIQKVIVTTRAAGAFEIKVGGVVVGSGRTNAANLNVEFNFSLGFPVATGITIDVEFTMLNGKINQDVEAYLMASDT